MDTQDGYAAGTLTRMTFDATGTLVLTYSNGQTVKGSKLALGRFGDGRRRGGGRRQPV
jgi:flagellar hook protein FlgE